VKVDRTVICDGKLTEHVPYNALIAEVIVSAGGARMHGLILPHANDHNFWVLNET
jgi:hypothetical protein